jgi:NAD(P)-dependent dehydrogenase (short-subunit alcohol dehydrogenase family)
VADRARSERSPGPADPAAVFHPTLLAGRTALVTGGASGIGFEMARGIGRVGGRVVLASRTVEKLERAVAALRADGIDAAWRQLNVREPDEVQQVIDTLWEELGGIDILVNNAGGTFSKKAEEISPNGWRAVIDLNLNGTFYCCRAVGRRMIERGEGGKIVNIVIGTADRSAGGISHTGSSRAGVLHLTRTLAVEWAPFGIQVNALGPQYLTPGAKEMYGQEVDDFITGSTPARRWATADELAAWAVVLTSPISDYLTGAMIPLDGGNQVGVGINFRGSAVLPE